MRITSKGQVTIPVHVREQSGLFPGTEVEFVVDGQDVRIVRAQSSRRGCRGETVVRRLRGSASARLSTDEIMSLTRSDSREARSWWTVMSSWMWQPRMKRGAHGDARRYSEYFPTIELIVP